MLLWSLTSHQQLRSYGDGTSVIVSSDGLMKPGIEPATLVYKASDISTVPRRLLAGRGKNARNIQCTHKSKIHVQSSIKFSWG